MGRKKITFGLFSMSVVEEEKLEIANAAMSIFAGLSFPMVLHPFYELELGGGGKELLLLHAIRSINFVHSYLPHILN